jgi:hypothetical protein
MQHQMLQPMDPEHVLSQVIEVRLQGDVDEANAGAKGGTLPPRPHGTRFNLTANSAHVQNQRHHAAHDHCG